MAIILLGRTPCSICGAALVDMEGIVTFPHFIADEMHPLSPHSDGGMHRACFATWKQADAFREIFARFVAERTPHRPRKMTAEGDIVADD
jgi:hypothetical protein